MLTVLVVKVDTEETTSVIRHDDIKTHYIPPIPILARKMIEDVIVRERGKPAIRALGTFELALIAEFGIPFSFTRWLVARLLSRGAIPSSGKDILPTLEDTPEQTDFLLQ